jgi:hypothetical protein
MTAIRPGPDGTALPAGLRIFRIGKNAELSPAALGQRKASEMVFKLSSTDLECPIPRLSVWVEELTVADQAWDFMGCKPANTVVACLSVDDVRGIEPPPGFAALGVEWEQSLIDDGNGNQIPNGRAGADGHSGITNLHQGKDKGPDKNKRKDLRSQLADKAQISPVPVPHDLPVEHLRVAAYFICQGGGASQDPAEAHWVKAIRQLRRERVARTSGHGKT